MKAVVMAGGIGTRLWPMSRRAKPKQFFDVAGEWTLLEETVKRLQIFFRAEDIFYSTIPDFAPEIKKVFPSVQDSNILIEPEKRDTGPAMGFVAAILANRFPDQAVVFVPSDHLIANEKEFVSCLGVAEQLINQSGKMIDIGVVPLFPSTNLGYTKIGNLLSQKDGIKIYQFRKHVEKPALDLAKKYLDEGNFLWHANYYMWTPAKFLQAFKETAPQAYKILEKIRDLSVQAQWLEIKELYQQLPKISFDYLVTEKIDPSQVMIIKGEFGWSDIGTWDVLFDQMKKRADAAGNYLKGNCVTLDTNQTLIYGSDHKIIATIGLNNMVVVDTPDALLICPQGKAAEVKKLIEKLKELGQEKFL